jgi:hypothetical protein
VAFPMCCTYRSPQSMTTPKILAVSISAIAFSIPRLVINHLLAASMTSLQDFFVLLLVSSGVASTLRLAVVVFLHLLSLLVVGKRTRRTVPRLVRFCLLWWIHLFSSGVVSCQFLSYRRDPSTLLFARYLCHPQGNHPNVPFLSRHSFMIFLSSIIRLLFQLRKRVARSLLSSCLIPPVSVDSPELLKVRCPSSLCVQYGISFGRKCLDCF